MLQAIKPGSAALRARSFGTKVPQDDAGEVNLLQREGPRGAERRCHFSAFPFATLGFAAT